MDMRNNMEGSSVDRDQLPSVNLIHTNPMIHEKIKDHLTQYLVRDPPATQHIKSFINYEAV